MNTSTNVPSFVTMATGASINTNNNLETHDRSGDRQHYSGTRKVSTSQMSNRAQESSVGANSRHLNYHHSANNSGLHVAASSQNVNVTNSAGAPADHRYRMNMQSSRPAGGIPDEFRTSSLNEHKQSMTSTNMMKAVDCQSNSSQIPTSQVAARYGGGGLSAETEAQANANDIYKTTSGGTNATYSEYRTSYPTGVTTKSSGEDYTHMSNAGPVHATTNLSTSGAHSTTAVSEGAAGTISGAVSTGGTSSVVRREYGEQRLVSVTERTDESRNHVIGEKWLEHEVRVPKKIIREEVFERVVVVPETRKVEEIISEEVKYLEKIIEVARPTIVEKVIEVPEIEIIEKVVEVPVETIREVVREEVVGEPEVIRVERVVRIPKEVEVPHKVVKYREQYRDVPVDVEEVVEVKVPYEHVVHKTTEVKVPTERVIEKEVPLIRRLPVPVNLEAEFEYRLPTLRPIYAKKSYPVYIPRFIQVPIPAELLTHELTAVTEQQLAQIHQFAQKPQNLCAIENAAVEIVKSQVHQHLQKLDVQQALQNAFHNNTLSVSANAMRRATAAQ